MLSALSYTHIDDKPDTLLDLCLKVVATSPETFCYINEENDCWNIFEGLTIPKEICEKLINIWQTIGPEKLVDKYIRIFESTSNTKVRNAVLRNSRITDSGLEILLRHLPQELDISKCNQLTFKTLENINKYGTNLTVLVLGHTKHIIPYKNTSQEVVENKKYILNTPNLRSLVAQDIGFPFHSKSFSFLLKPLLQLKHLDLSGCNCSQDLNSLLDLNNLQSLILHNVHNIQSAVPVICQVKTLRFLDVSNANNDFDSIHAEKFTSPNIVLSDLIDSLPNLTGLDISGTNLAGDGSFPFDIFMSIDKDRKLHSETDSSLNNSSVSSSSQAFLCDIPGLSKRVTQPLQFLGLLGTAHEASRRKNIPAKIIAGDANEEQIMVAISVYMDRTEMLISALNQLFYVFRYETCNNQSKALSLILNAMSRHRMDRHIQNEERSSLPYRFKQKIIATLLDAMESFCTDKTMIRNGCLTLLQFAIPHDVLFEYARLVKLLLQLVQSKDSESFVIRVSIFLLNSLACQVDGQFKELVGDLGAIETMLKLISDKLTKGIYDDVVEIAWSAMWNVTDETPINCQRFLNGQGMEYFLQCLMKFHDKEELLRNMMGLLGNVAEVKELRPRLMTAQLIKTFANLLDSRCDGIEVSYNAAGVLSHIASDGESAWTIESPNRHEVLERMVSAIERSFEPILRLLKVHHTPQCQHWAAWALANLTLVYPNKYCSLVEEENGIAFLQDILLSSQAYHSIRVMVKRVILHCAYFKEHQTLDAAKMYLDLSEI